MSTKTRRVLGLLLFLVVWDQVAKLLVDWALPLHASVPVIDGFFNLTYIRNSGAAFGIFAELEDSLRRPFLIGFSLLAIGFIVHLLRRLPPEEDAIAFALTLILGGALGNLIDRSVYGEVIDFLDFYWAHFHWPAFNFADSFITTGVSMLAFRLIFSKEADPFAASSR